MSLMDMSEQDGACRVPAASHGQWNPHRSSYMDTYNNSFENGFYTVSSPGSSYPVPTYKMRAGAPIGTNNNSNNNSSTLADPAFSNAGGFNPRPSSSAYHGSSVTNQYSSHQNGSSQSWETPGRYSPTDSVDDILASPNLSDFSLDNGMKPNNGNGKSKNGAGKPRPQRKPSNRDEFDGPHQFLQRPPPAVVAMQERELPHLPTNLHIQEQDQVLSKVNDRLSQCAFDFVAKYQFPIPLTQDMRPVERPQDREWTEWVYLLKRLATKRRIPARVLYNGQIKQFVTILENSLEMRHAAKHQSRPLKDDRNILQLISAGIQVAKILKDAAAMDYLDQLYVSTEKQIQERTSSRFRM